MTPTSSFRAVFRGGKTWAQIEAEPEPNRAGHLLPLDYSSTKSLVGLDNPRMCIHVTSAELAILLRGLPFCP